MSALGQKQTFAVQKVMSALPPKSGHSSAWCEPGHAGLICPGLESGGAAQESCVMLLRPQFNHYCEVVGRASAFVAFVTMASLILAATAVDVLR
jgi:hypothetical protein